MTKNVTGLPTLPSDQPIKVFARLAASIVVTAIIASRLASRVYQLHQLIPRRVAARTLMKARKLLSCRGENCMEPSIGDCYCGLRLYRQPQSESMPSSETNTRVRISS